jgi:hypothetical protein
LVLFLASADISSFLSANSLHLIHLALCCIICFLVIYLCAATLPIWELTTFYQFTSTLAALRYITTPFVAKTRSDEAFSDLGPLLAAAVDNPQALISSNIYLRVAAQQPALVVPTSTGANAKSSRSTSDTGDSSNSSNSNDDRAAMSLVSDHLFAGATTNIWAVSSLLVLKHLQSFIPYHCSFQVNHFEGLVEMTSHVHVAFLKSC